MGIFEVEFVEGGVLFVCFFTFALVGVMEMDGYWEVDVSTYTIVG